MMVINMIQVFMVNIIMAFPYSLHKYNKHLANCTLNSIIELKLCIYSHTQASNTWANTTVYWDILNSTAGWDIPIYIQSSI